MSRGNLLDYFRQDVKFATRALKRAGGFTSTAIARLALGVERIVAAIPRFHHENLATLVLTAFTASAGQHNKAVARRS